MLAYTYKARQIQTTVDLISLTSTFISIDSETKTRYIKFDFNRHTPQTCIIAEIFIQCQKSKIFVFHTD